MTKAITMHNDIKLIPNLAGFMHFPGINLQNEKKLQNAWDDKEDSYMLLDAMRKLVRGISGKMQISKLILWGWSNILMNF